MLTKTDFKKLKEIFATKEDLKRFVTKGDLKSLVTKEDLKNELINYATKEDLRTTTDQLIQIMTEGFSSIIEKLDNSIRELQSHRIVLGNHEERLQKAETKIFSQG